MDYNIKSIREDFKKKGIFYTPPELAEMIKSYVPFKPSEVYDPTCGDGGLLGVFPDSVVKYGQEINQKQIEVAEQKLINFIGHCGDTLKSPAFLGKKFDCIVANPPFSIEWEPIQDERFSQSPTIPTKSRADYAFILHILHYLSNTGVAVVLSFPGVLYRGNREGIIRQWLVEQNFIEKIVLIPGDTFIDTKIATALIVFNKNKKNTDIVFHDRSIEKVESVPLEEIRKQNYNLSVSTYVQQEQAKEIIDEHDLQKKARNGMMAKLKNDLKIDREICKLSGMTMDKYLDDLSELIVQFKEKNTNE